MEEIPEELVQLLKKLTTCKTSVWVDDPLDSPGHIAIWNGGTTVNLYNCQGIEIDYWQFGRPPENKSEVKELIKQHYKDEDHE